MILLTIDKIIDGRKIAADILARLKAKLAPKKFLAAVLVGHDASSVSFLKQKEKAAKELGVDFRLYKFPVDIKQYALRDEVRKLAEHKTCGGVVVQLPLPDHINVQYVLNAIPREKDADVLGERALGAFYAGRNPVLPPAVGVVEEIIVNCKLKIENLNVAVVGRGVLVGKPIAAWLTNKKVKELSVLGSKSDLGALKDADLVILGAGQARLVEPGMLKKGAGVIDFGYDGGRGDFDASNKSQISNLKIWYTPTPGGTGPILVSKLLENFYKLNQP